MRQIIAGVFQSTGWPSVVSVMANWYGKGKRGLVMGIWNAHTSLGNILGTVIAAACLQYGWGYAFIVPGMLIFLLGLVVYAVLVVQPSDVGLTSSVYEPVKTTEAVSSPSEASGIVADSSSRSCSSCVSRESSPGSKGDAVRLSGQQHTRQAKAADHLEAQVGISAAGRHAAT